MPDSPVSPDRAARAVERFRELLRIPTMSRNDVETTRLEAASTRFVEALPRLYPDAPRDARTAPSSPGTPCSTAGRDANPVRRRC